MTQSVDQSAQIHPLAVGIKAMISSAPDPYAASCAFLCNIFSILPISLDDKLDVLTDVSMVLDGLQPSARSGIVFPAKPSRKGQGKRKGAGNEQG